MLGLRTMLYNVARGVLYVLVALASTSALGADSAGRLPKLDLPVRFTTWLSDGSCVTGPSRPIVAFGTVRIPIDNGSARLVLVGEVNLSRSRAQWESAEPWAILDSSPIQGQTFPKLDFLGEQGATSRIRPPPDGLLAVILFHHYCGNCVREVQRASERARDLVGDQDLRFVAIDFSDDHGQWRHLLEDKGIRGTAKWVNGSVVGEPSWVLAATRNSAIGTFLIDSSGRVLHSLMNLPLTAESVDTFWPVLRRERERLERERDRRPKND
jgi:hypothetical protein